MIDLQECLKVVECCVICLLTIRIRLYVFCFFFFQAEDGIRDLVRSRGLGDVYKRQAPDRSIPGRPVESRSRRGCETLVLRSDDGDTVPAPAAVSYTHLTLPTSDLV